MFLADTASVGIMDNTVHRARRELLNPLFTLQHIINMESVIWNAVNNLCDRLQVYAPSSGQPSAGKRIGTKVLFKLMTSDIISDFCYGKSFNSIQAAKMKPTKPGVECAVPPRFIKALAGAAENFWLWQRFWRLQRLLVNLPDWLVDIFKIEASLGMRDLITV